MRWFMDFWKDFANSTETPHVWLGLKSKKSVRRTNALALEQTYIQSVRYADKKSQKRATDPAAHTSTLISNYKMTCLQGMFSYIAV